MFNLTETLFLVANNGAEFILYLLILISVFSVAIMLERFVTLGNIKKQSEKVNSTIIDVFKFKRFDILNTLRSEDSIHGRVLDIALNDQLNQQSVKEAFNSFVLTNRKILDRGLPWLATIGSNAPFIGLLGTVLGIMKAFKDLGMAQGSTISSTQAVMSGIAEALVATAVGLFVAIPAVIAFNIFQKKVKFILNSLEALREFCLVYRNQTQSTDKKPKGKGN